MPETAVVICPGRGSYNKPELGSLAQHHSDAQAQVQLQAFDARRRALGQTSLSELDAAARFSRDVHTRGDNASSLIFAAALFDARKIDARFDVVGVTGNSMGWYIALTAGAAATPEAGFEIVNTMGVLMQERMIGGQCLYPFVDDDWRPIPGLRDALLARVADIGSRPGHDLAVSIHLGGMLVVAGNQAGLAAFEADLSPRDRGRYPMRLPNHAAFHTDLQIPVAREGQQRLDVSLFGTPEIPLIDGEGRIWQPLATTPEALRAYTLGTQVTQVYDFTKAVQVAARTFAPDVFILTGPGNALGGAVAQALIAINWWGLESKAQFTARQKERPLILSMGRPDDRARVLGVP